MRFGESARAALHARRGWLAAAPAPAALSLRLRPAPARAGLHLSNLHFCPIFAQFCNLCNEVDVPPGPLAPLRSVVKTEEAAKDESADPTGSRAPRLASPAQPSGSPVGCICASPVHPGSIVHTFPDRQ